MKKVIYVSVFLMAVFTTHNAYAGGDGINEDVSNRAQQSLKKYSPPADSDFGGIGLGADNEWRVHPGIEVKTTVDTNVNREGAERDKDVIFTFTPSVGVKREGERVGVDATYEFEYEQYVDDSSQSSFNHRLETALWYKGNGLNVTVDNKLGDVKTVASSEQSERRRFIFDNFEMEARYELDDKIDGSIVYDTDLVRYTDSILEEKSYWRNDIGGRIYYKATDKIEGFVEGQWNIVSYFRSGGDFSSDGYSVFAGIVGRLSERMVLNAKAGFRYRDYDDSSINPYKNVAGEGILEYDLTSKIDLYAQLKKDVQESIFSTTGWYETSLFALGATYGVSSNIDIDVSGSFRHNRYPREVVLSGINKKRRDNPLVVESKLMWTPVQNFNVLFGYKFESRESNFNSFDYKAHIAEMALTYKI